MYAPTLITLLLIANNMQGVMTLCITAKVIEQIEKTSACKVIPG